MDSQDLAVESRFSTGKEAAHKARAQGFIPAIVYGKGMEPISVTCQPSQIRDVMKSERKLNTVLKLLIPEREAVFAMIRDIQLHPVSRSIIHADFVRVFDDQAVVVEVPVNFVGKPEGVATGGMLQPIRRRVMMSCLPKDIPVALDVDVSALDVGDSLLVKNVPVPEGTAIVARNNYALATVLK